MVKFNSIGTSINMMPYSLAKMIVGALRGMYSGSQT